MGHLLDLPLELLGLIVGHLQDDKASLSAFSLVSRASLPPSQAQLFKRINIWHTPVLDNRSSGNTEKTQKRTSLDSSGTRVLSYTRTLSLSMVQPLFYPQHLDDIFDVLIAFKKVRALKIPLFATHYVRHPLTSPARYFAHFQSTLRSLCLETWWKNPWDLITFITYFPLLEDLTIQMLSTYPPTLPESVPEGPEPPALSPFQGSLQLRQFYQKNTLVLELLKHQVQYHTLSFRQVTAWAGIQELIVACTATLRVLDFLNICEFSPPPTKASVDCWCLVFWDYRRAESILGSLAGPLRVQGVEGDQFVSHQPRKPVRDRTSSHSPIDDIFTPPSKDHPHRQRQSFRQ